jgi:hypothetical protein
VGGQSLSDENGKLADALVTKVVAKHDAVSAKQIML